VSFKFTVAHRLPFFRLDRPPPDPLAHPGPAAKGKNFIQVGRFGVELRNFNKP